jgi:hypothetical protein
MDTRKRLAHGGCRMHKALILSLTMTCTVAGCSNQFEKPHQQTPKTIQTAVRAPRPAEWVFLGNYDEGRQNVFVDISSIQIAGDIRRAWIRWVFPPESAKSQSYILYGSAFNCAEGSNRDEAEIIYYNDGSNYHSEGAFGDDGTTWIRPAESSANPWLQLPAGTPWNVAMNFVCKWKAG